MFFQRKAHALKNGEHFNFQTVAPVVAEKDPQPMFANSFLPEIGILMHRELLSVLRTPAIFIIRLVLAVCVHCSSHLNFLLFICTL